MTSILQGKRGPMRTPKPAPRADHFRGTYLSTMPVVSRETARAAALTILRIAKDDREALDLITILGIKETAA